MAHKTLVGGTVYEIKGGKTLINGTAYSIKNGKTLVGGTAYEVGFVSVKEILDSWATIAAGTNISKYNIGDWKSIVLTDGTIVIMEIVAFNADTKTDGTTAAITWISKDIITTHLMHSSSTTKDGWGGSDMRTWLQNDFYATMPNDVKNAIVSVNKTYYDYYGSKSTKSCVDNLWIPSVREMGAGTAETSGAEYTGYFTDKASRVKSNANGVASPWWLRSSQSNYDFYMLNYAGNLRNGSRKNANGVVIGFCT